jgi:hypothetical protein
LGKRKSLAEAVPWVGPEPLNADFWIPDVPIEVVYVQELAKLCLKTAAHEVSSFSGKAYRKSMNACASHFFTG